MAYLVQTTCISIEEDTHGFCENCQGMLLCECVLTAFDGFMEEGKSDVGTITRCDGRGRVGGTQEVNIGEEARDQGQER